MERAQTERVVASRRPRRAVWRLRATAAALLVALAAAGAGAACGTSDSAPAASAEVDPGPTYGAEIAVSIAGRGSVKAQPGTIDCPGTCFTRLVLRDTQRDGSDAGITLVAEASDGAHFAGWSIDPTPLGVRARGPSSCSPMTRVSATPAGDLSLAALTVHLGETRGTPPLGREAECEAFTTVPLAYSLVATFAEDVVDAGKDAGDAGGVELLFEPPVAGPVVGKEIGVTNGMLYWRFVQNGLSGIASGPVQGGPATVLVPPVDVITVFDVASHVVFQHASGVLEGILGGGSSRVPLDGAPACAAVASDSANVYCRSTSTQTSSSLYVWPLVGATSATLLHTLPPGYALAADDQRLYFSRDPGQVGQATIEATSRSGDGGVPPSSGLAYNRTAPRALTALATSYLFWLEDLGTGATSALVSPKGGGGGQVRLSGLAVRIVAADPTANTLFIGLVNGGAAGSSIVKASPSTPTTSTVLAQLGVLGGLATDGVYLYFTESDGRVYRAPKP